MNTNNNDNIVIRIENLKKQYRLGVIGGGTLRSDIESWMARIRKKEDPNTKIGEEQHHHNKVFMALKGIDLEVKKGDKLGIVGGNGAGKSTLLKLLSRVTSPTEGTIYMQGRVSSMLEVGTGFNGELTGRENIYMNGAILGMKKKEVDMKMEQIIEFSECAQFIDTPVKRYSSGMYVKLAFAVAAHLDSEILVMDEVLAVGDMKFQEKCLGKMGDVADNEGRTVLYVSHNMNTIRQLCNRCVVLNKGKLIFDGDVEEAINIYMDNNIEETALLTGDNLKHDKYVEDRGIRFTSIELINKTNKIDSNEDFQFSIQFINNYIAKNLSLRVGIQFADETPVGTAFFYGLNDYCKNGIGKVNLNFNITNLAPGKYKTKFVLYDFNEFGAYDNYAAIGPALTFEKLPSVGGLSSIENCWYPRIWGHVRFPDMQVIN